MASGQLHTFIRQLRRLVGPDQADGVTDAALLERFVAQRDQAAFEVLLWRHGPMVLGVCRRLLSGVQDIEDAFQATFLVLVRKARAIRQRDQLGSWLYKVAYRIALRVQGGAARRALRERPGAELLTTEPADDLLWRDVRPVLDDEISQLPERYRGPFILCYLEGKTNEEAARNLGCPVGTILSRLAWARERLRSRLTRRGLTLSSAMLATLLTSNTASATVPVLFVDSTLKAAILFAAGKTAAGALPASATALAEGVLKSMFLIKLKMAAAILLAVGVIGAGTGVIVQGALATAPPGVAEERETPQPVAEKPKDSPPSPRAKNAGDRKHLVEVPSRREGIVVLIGTEIKDGENLPADRIVTSKIGDEVKKYRRWKEGDTVEEGQLLARLDDRLARDELAIRMAKLKAAEADHQAVQKTRAEAEIRLRTIVELFKKGAASREEVQGAQLTLDRYVSEEISKQQTIEVAKREVKQAETLLEMCEIRSPVRGVIKVIYKHKGEAAKNLEPVFQIELADKP